MAEEDKGENKGELRFRADEPRVHTTADLKETRLGRAADIGEKVILRRVSVGAYSYFERGGEAAHATIGKFCSIAAYVRINAVDHPLERITTHKISYRPNEYFRFQGVDHGFAAQRSDCPVSIGHDVWIGHAAIVMPGVTVGNGAVIGAGAVVTQDVAPFTIVAGVPARPLRRRFDEAVSERIEALAWWDWPKERLFDAVADMQALSVTDFLAKWEAAPSL